jgi:hypothetical protein
MHTAIPKEKQLHVFGNFLIKPEICRYIYGYNIKYHDFPASRNRFESKIA